MAITTIGIGATPNDGGGDDLRTAGAAINANFAELDDRTAGFGSASGAHADSAYVDAIGSVGYGTTAPVGHVEIEGLNGEVYGLFLDIDDLGDVAAQAMVLKSAVIEDFAPSQDVFHRGDYTILDASAVVTPTDGSGDRHYVYGNNINIDVGSAYQTIGNYILVDALGADVTQAGQIYGLWSQARSLHTDVTGAGPDIYSAFLRSTAGHTAGTIFARGLQAEVQQDGAGGTLSTAYAVSAEIDHNAGVMTTAAQFYGTTSGSPGTSWGMYSSGAKSQYFEAAAASGEAFKIDLTNASFAGDGLVVEAAPAAGTGFDLIVGNANNGADPVFRVRGDGQVTADGSFTGGGADYAELYEWADGNSDSADRVGLSVVSDGGGKIREATKEDNPAKIIGVVSGAPVVLGDAAAMAWTGKYLKDDFNRPLLETYAVLEWIDDVEEMTRAD